MSSIHIKNLNFQYPIYGTNTRCFKNTLLRAATGGIIEKSANNSAWVSALCNLNLKIEHGERIGLIGHNGAGKSSLLKIIAGIYETDHAVVSVNGSVSALLDMNVGFLAEMTGYENILTRALVLGLSNDETQALIQDVEEFTDLGNYLAMPIKSYSSGMSLRLAFAVSTAINPDILLIDEIIGVGDASFMKKAKKRVSNWIEKAHILILSSHADEALLDFCDELLWLDKGKMVDKGPTKTLLKAYKKSLEEKKS
jgi:ABC-type polysaccharide/polyol phosphate transport system ATPase subunit